GSVNLSTLATLQKAIRNEEKRTSKSIVPERRAELLEMIDSKTEEQTERLVAVEFPHLVKENIEYVKPVSATETRVNVVFNDEEMAIMTRVKEVTSHSHFNASWKEIMIVTAKEFLSRHDPLEKAARAEKRKAKACGEVEADEAATAGIAGANSTSERLAETDVKVTGLSSACEQPDNEDSILEHSDPKSSDSELLAQIAPALRNQILYRDNGACVFVDRETGRCCGSRERVEVDHIISRALGGTDEPENLRTLCRTHNLLMARKAFGSSFMAKKIREAQRRGEAPSNSDPGGPNFIARPADQGNAPGAHP
ncbi:MAG: HNH endonuclease signature motif containing protein, partial [Bdellovibrionota bacterium]